MNERILGKTQKVEKYLSKLASKKNKFSAKMANLSEKAALSKNPAKYMEKIKKQEEAFAKKMVSVEKKIEKARERLAKKVTKYKGKTAKYQKLLSEKGLPRRPWYRHQIYAPGFYTGYGVKTLPGVREGIEEHNWKESQERISVLAEVLMAFDDTILQALSLLK
jgi:N-acetylated-alpha-linked acidic dipeptidase